MFLNNPVILMFLNNLVIFSAGFETASVIASLQAYMVKEEDLFSDLEQVQFSLYTPVLFLYLENV